MLTTVTRPRGKAHLCCIHALRAVRAFTRDPKLTIDLSRCSSSDSCVWAPRCRHNRMHSCDCPIPGGSSLGAQAPSIRQGFPCSFFGHSGVGDMLQSMRPETCTPEFSLSPTSTPSGGQGFGDQILGPDSGPKIRAKLTGYLL